jgi:hypothetical protein
MENGIREFKKYAAFECPFLADYQSRFFVSLEL